MNIKNERVHALAREAARRTGKSQTSVLEEALTAYLEKLGGGETARQAAVDLKLAQARGIVAEFSSTLGDPDREAIRRRMESMYDESGLPT